ncbi:MAG: hypothetical protein AB7P03_20650 [Kofleriaceae bacterium]
MAACGTRPDLGEVYLVEHVQIGRLEAVKVMRGDLTRRRSWLGSAARHVPSLGYTTATSGCHDSVGTTPLYTAPGMIEGVHDDPRIELYPLGCIAWELLPGEAVFAGRVLDAMHVHVTQRCKHGFRWERDSDAVYAALAPTTGFRITFWCGGSR